VLDFFDDPATNHDGIGVLGHCGSRRRVANPETDAHRHPGARPDFRDAGGDGGDVEGGGTGHPFNET
jgi:hypothetical protein